MVFVWFLNLFLAPFIAIISLMKRGLVARVMFLLSCLSFVVAFPGNTVITCFGITGRKVSKGSE